jgi:glycosyltransferase involved in cell wall biosynthesis
MKLPVITTKNTGCVDSIIESQTGIYTDINPESIFRSIEYYLTNPNLRKIHGENGREFVIYNYSQLVVWESLAKIYFF